MGALGQTDTVNYPHVETSLARRFDQYAQDLKTETPYTNCLRDSGNILTKCFICSLLCKVHYCYHSFLIFMDNFERESFVVRVLTFKLSICWEMSKDYISPFSLLSIMYPWCSGQCFSDLGDMKDRLEGDVGRTFLHPVSMLSDDVNIIMNELKKFDNRYNPVFIATPLFRLLSYTFFL